jgi:hypothetical protein
MIRAGTNSTEAVFEDAESMAHVRREFKYHVVSVLKYRRRNNLYTLERSI